MERVFEIFHKAHGYLRNLTSQPIQIGGLVGGFILEPWPESAGQLPTPMWEAAPRRRSGAIFTTERTGKYRQDLPVRPGNWGGDWVGDEPHIYAPIVWVVPEDVEIPEDRRDLIRRWEV